MISLYSNVHQDLLGILELHTERQTWCIYIAYCMYNYYSLLTNVFQDCSSCYETYTDGQKFSKW